MYGYEAPIEISPEQLLQKITQEQIFEFVLKEPFNFSFRYLSPFREDKKAGCRFEQREDGTILFIDFGERFLTGRTHRNCFRMMMDKFHCNIETSIKILCEHFSLPTTLSDYQPVIIRTEEYKKKTVSNRAGITYIAKPLNKADILEWSQYLIRPEHLKEDNVFSVKRYTIDSPTKGVKIFTPYKYCYAIDFLSAVKIYQPYQDEGKFITNCTENHIGNIDNLPPTGDELIIKKSYKDHRVVRNVLSEVKTPSVVYFQNEGCEPSLEIISMLMERFKLLTIFFDNDVDGIIAATKLYDSYNSLKPNSTRMVHIPTDIPYKDPAAFVKREGRRDTLDLFKYMGLWKS